jgi:hypothetical protein
MESSSENSIMDLEKIEYKRQNAISDERTETTLLLNDNNGRSKFPIKIECIHISILSIGLVGVVIAILILTGNFSS